MNKNEYQLEDMIFTSEAEVFPALNAIDTLVEKENQADEKSETKCEKRRKVSDKPTEKKVPHLLYLLFP